MSPLLSLLGVVFSGVAIGLVLWQRGAVRPAVAGDEPVEAPVETQPVRNLQEVIRRFEDDDTDDRSASVLARIAARLTPPQRAARLEQRIVQAAESDKFTLSQLFEFKLMGMLIGFVIGAAIVFVLGITMATLGLAAGLTVFGFVAVDLSLNQRAATRQRSIERALPDMLDQMVISVEAGLGLESALTRIARTNQNPLADEINRTLRDMRLGASRGEAFRALLDRVEVPDLRLFVRALIQADRGGIPVAAVCRVQAEEARVKRRQRAEERAMRLPVKMVFPLISCILPSLFIVVLGPAVLRLMANGVI